MKLISTLVLLLVLSTSLAAQSLTAEYIPEFSSLSTSEFPLKNSLLIQSPDTYQFGSEDKQVTVANPISFSVSKDRVVVGSVAFSGELSSSIYSDDGFKLSEITLENADPSDETIDLAVANTGEFIIRDNVANFSFFDAAGNRAFTYSNSSQARDGELPSGVELSADGVLKVVYNPVIRYQGDEGSRAFIVIGDREADEIFSYEDRVIESLWLSDDGYWIHAVTADASGSKRVHLFDRFGNTVLEVDPELDVTHYSVTEDKGHIVLYSGNRVQVFNSRTGERLGSATSRSEIVHASYFPEQNLVLAVGGQYQGNTVSNPEITAVDLQQRQLERYQLEGSFSFLNRSNLHISNQGGGVYQLDGMNRPVQIEASF